MGISLVIQSAAIVTLPGPNSLTVGPVTITGTINPQISQVTLASGFNSVTVPAGAVGVMITPPSNNAFTLTMKGIIGDTGIKISMTTTSVFIFDSVNLPATIGITASGLTTSATQIMFF